jgi:D-beta-D-heptose 7-phosphate kinase/D-beta-D-heptose 1-phosphate adenosyltransferase
MDSLSKEGLVSLLKGFQGKKLLVIGDLIVSRFVEVEARKLAREAPVPAGDYVGETLAQGGAGNLSRELASLGATVTTVGVVGEDEHGKWLKEDLGRKGITTAGISLDSSRPTSLRTWIMVNRFHSVRIDREVRKDVQLQIAKTLLDAAEPVIRETDCIVLSDYDRGVLTPALIGGVVAAARAAGKIVVAQPKMKHYLDFSGVTYVKSNLDEATHATGMRIVNETTLRNLGVNLISRLDCKAILVTRGEHGITLFERESFTNFPPLHGKKNLFNKIGVRDAMTAGFALAVAAGGNIYEAACLSNIAGEERSVTHREVSLSIPDLEKQFGGLDDFFTQIVQAPVRR